MIANRWGRLGAKLAAVPTIISTEHGRVSQLSLLEKIINKILAPITNQIIAVSDNLRDYIIQNEGISPAKIKVIRNGINLSRFGKRIDAVVKKKELGIHANHSIVGIIASLTQVKNHKTLIKAVPFILQSVPKVTFLIVGDGPLMNQHQNLVRQLGLQDAFIFLGNRDDVPSLLSIFDVSVLCSLYEGISITILESMAAGKPVVATNVGGNPEVVKDGVTGYLVPQENPNELAKKIIHLLRNPKLAERMGNAGRTLVEKEYSYERMAEETRQLYRDIEEI